MKGLRSQSTRIGKYAKNCSFCLMATLICSMIAMAVGGWAAPALEASAFNGGRSVLSAGTQPEADGRGPTMVVPLGTTFGVKLFTDGVIVASLSDIYTEAGGCCPAREAGVQPGDYVVKANGLIVESNAGLAKLIGGSAGQPMDLTIRRGEKLLDVTVTPVFSGGSFKTGMWIRDSAAGIGTLTFWDPATGRYGGLGHGICDMDTGGVMALEHGETAPIALCGIVRGEPDKPGQLRGYFSSDEALGTLVRNNDTGVYGALYSTPTAPAVEVMGKEQVQCGPVQIMATIDENGPILYDAEIQRISARNQHTRNLVVKITDPRLIAATGGIVQGMSGSPILQDGKLAGAITHVFTDDPTMGYGIFAETMCQECTWGTTEKAATG